MKIALISDIHGNAPALSAVLQDIRLHGIDRLLCCGDLVGYYYEPATCLEMLSEWNMECVRGNHEDMLFQLIEDPTTGNKIRKKYGSALDLAMDTLSAKQLAYLSGLPRTRMLSIDGQTIMLCHGAPWDTDQYIYPDASEGLFAKCAKTDADWIVCGHTHYQLLRTQGKSRILNPGSVGQPRGRYRGNAQWALLDLDKSVCEHKTTQYDASDVIKQVLAHDPDVDYLSAILMKETG